MGLLIEDVGLIGLILYSIIFIITLYQLKIHFIPYYEPFYTSRKIFHILLSIYCLLQAISFICFCQGYNSYTKLCYICHIFGIFFENIAISAINILWAKMVIPKMKRYILPILGFGSTIYLGYCIYISENMMQSNKSFSDWGDGSKSFRYFLMVEPCVLAINGILFLILGWSIWLQLKSTSSWNAFEKKKKNIVLIRLVITITLCCLSILLRVIFQLLILVHHKDHVSYNVKWIFTTWIPNLIPALIFLYALVSSIIIITII